MTNEQQPLPLAGVYVDYIEDSDGNRCSAKQAEIASHLCHLLPGLGGNFTQPRIAQALVELFAMDTAHYLAHLFVARAGDVVENRRA